jgi:signal transduction histidine kinase
LRLGWAVSLLAVLGVALGLLGPVAPPSGGAPPQQFMQAWEHSQPFDGSRFEAGSPHPAPLDLPAPGDAAAWRSVELPHREPAKAAPSADAPKPLKVWWYRVAYTVPAGVEGPLALYVPRLGGGAAQVVGHDGQGWQLRWDGADHWREQWNRPILVDLGRAPPAGQTLQLAVGLIRYDTGSHRVARISVGPREELAFRDGWRRLLQLTAPQVGSLTFLALGLFAFLFWLRRRNEQAYLLFSFSSVVWTLRSLHYYVDFPRDETAYVWFWWVTNAALSWVMMLIYLFAFRFDPRSYPRVERALVVFVLAMSFLTMPMPWSPAATLIVQHLFNSAVAVGITAFLGVLAWRGGGREFRVIVGALWVSEVFGAHDLLLVSGWVGPESIYLLPFATVLVLMAFLYAVQRRYAQAIDQVERANQNLEQRLAEREAELQANHERLRGIEREQALLLERQRLMRDMHDGLGSTLMSSLVLVEQGRLDAPAVALLLRECVDDLRLVIDSLEPIGHDLVTLLASLRHRLGRRLEAAGLAMQWEVEDLPPLEWLHPPDALQVLRIVQEVLTNVLKHASAQTVRIATRRQGDGVQVLIEDDGHGFDPEAAGGGRGLRHLTQRAARLGGRLVLDSAPGRGTRIQLDLPLQRGVRA